MRPAGIAERGWREDRRVQMAGDGIKVFKPLVGRIQFKLGIEGHGKRKFEGLNKKHDARRVFTFWKARKIALHARDLLRPIWSSVVVGAVFEWERGAL